MGLATIDPHNQKEHTKIHKIPTFGVNRASFEILQDSIQKGEVACITAARSSGKLGLSYESPI